MENFVVENLYRVQLCPKIGFDGCPLGDCFDKQDMFDFDKDGNCFVFVNDFVKFTNYIESQFGSLMYIKSIVHISDDSFIYEG